LSEGCKRCDNLDQRLANSLAKIADLQFRLELKPDNERLRELNAEVRIENQNLRRQIEEQAWPERELLTKISHMLADAGYTADRDEEYDD
jgi:regulator of replication initiation timing